MTNVVHALVSAQKANIMLDFKMATAIDLAGRDVFEAVQMSVNPKVINTPPVAAVAKDGIQLIAKARVTVRANIKQLVGGAGEETVLARVGEGIVSSIGSALSHKIVLENPDSISRVVLEKGLDAGTAFEILSIDIADIDVGKNIGAQLQMDQAEADKNIAQAKAEERRAMAVALEQENKAKKQIQNETVAGPFVASLRVGDDTCRRDRHGGCIQCADAARDSGVCRRTRTCGGRAPAGGLSAARLRKQPAGLAADHRPAVAFGTLPHDFRLPRR